MEQIDIMPKTLGSGPQGTQELLSVGKPLLAALNLTPIGRGILGAVGTMATIPEESEAGIFKVFRRSTGTTTQLVKGGLVAFPDKTLNLEFATSGFAKYLAEGGKVDNLMSQLRPMQGVHPIYDDTLNAAKDRMNNMPISIATNKEMTDVHKVGSGTHAFYQPVTRGGGRPQLGYVKAREGQEAYSLADSITHEVTHGLDVEDDILRAIMFDKADAIKYNDKLTESRAFLAGSRTNFPEALTSPTSPDFLHPMLSYSGGKVSIAPYLEMTRTARESYTGIGKEFDEVYTKEYKTLLKQEADKINSRLTVDIDYKIQLEKATRAVDLTTADWVMNPSQLQALENKKRVILDKVNRNSLDITGKAEYDSIKVDVNKLDKRRQIIREWADNVGTNP